MTREERVPADLKSSIVETLGEMAELISTQPGILQQISFVMLERKLQGQIRELPLAEYVLNLCGKPNTARKPPHSAKVPAKKRSLAS